MSVINGGTVGTLLGAIVWAVFGYLSRQDEENFEPTKLFSTFFAALFIAVLTVGWGVQEDIGSQFFEIFGIKSGMIGIIDKIIKTIWRRWLKSIWENFNQ